MQRDGNSCHVCTAPFTEDNPATLDHLLELANGGRNHLSNLALAHAKCNRHRSNRPGWVEQQLRTVVNQTKRNGLERWEDDGGYVPAGHLGMRRNWQ